MIAGQLAALTAAARPAAAPPPSYTTGAVHFDGATWFEKALPFSGAVASAKYLLSAWYNNPVELPGNTAHSMNFYCTYPNINAEATGVFNQSPAGSFFTTLDQSSSPNGAQSTAVDIFPTIVWKHIAISADYSSGDPDNIYQVYIDGLPISMVPFYGTSAPDSFPWNSTAVDDILFFLTDGYNDVVTSVDIADMYFNPYENLDLSVPANLAKLISGGKPVDLGANGQNVTGTAPAFFFRRAPAAAAATFADNLGTAGTVTVTGTLTNASTSPSD